MFGPFVELAVDVKTVFTAVDVRNSVPASVPVEAVTSAATRRQASIARGSEI